MALLGKQKPQQRITRTLTRDPSDAGLVIFFFEEAIEDEAQTQVQGRPVYKTVDFIRIVMPPTQFDPTREEYIGTVTNREKNRFPQEWAEYEANKLDPTDGTPIKMWPAINISQVKELAAVGVRTVEELAELSPRDVKDNPWIDSLHKKAVEWINATTDNDELLRLSARIDELEAQVDQLTEDKKELINTLRSNMAAATAPSKRLNSKTLED